MFGRRKHVAASVDVAPVEFDAAQIHDIVSSKLADLIGVHGSWTLVRRTDAHTDEIFHAMLTEQVANEVTRAIIETRDPAAPALASEPAALGWMPKPIAVWTDDIAAELDTPPMEELLDTTDTDSNEIVPARHYAEAIAV